MRSPTWPLAAVFALAVAAQAPAADFYAYYTKLDYAQPPMPDWVGRIPVNAANVFSGGRPTRRPGLPRRQRSAGEDTRTSSST